MNSRRLAYVAGAGAAAQLGRDAYRGAKSTATWLARRKAVRKGPKGAKYYTLYRPLTSYDVKRCLTDVTWTTYSTNTQQFFSLGNISQGTDINQRLRQVVQPICADVEMVFTANLATFTVYRWALIQPKSNRDLTGTNINNEFFRGSNAIRGVDFDQVFKGSHKHQYPINRDIYKVYAEGTFNCGGSAGAGLGSGNTIPSVHRLQRKIYFPRGTVILYEGPTSADDQTAPIFVWWTCRPECTSTLPNEGAGIGPFAAGGHIILHYKEMV